MTYTANRSIEDLVRAEDQQIPMVPYDEAFEDGYFSGEFTGYRLARRDCLIYWLVGLIMGAAGARWLA